MGDELSEVSNVFINCAWCGEGVSVGYKVVEEWPVCFIEDPFWCALTVRLLNFVVTNDNWVMITVAKVSMSFPRE